DYHCYSTDSRDNHGLF
nr:immunoglobulin light chain junction region [Macaca mulatta]MOX35302.1 immunoglobulin light chain junction region [Macaca mulatta]MOX35825.1 immunoglobulin light chain junction region [Macaca mulatta]